MFLREVWDSCGCLTMVRARDSCSNLKMREIDVINSSKLRMVCTRGRCWNLRTRMTGLYGYLMKVRARGRTVIWGRHEQGRDSSQNGASEKTLVSVKTSLLGHAWRERKICAEDEKNYNQLIINGLSVAGCMEREREKSALKMKRITINLSLNGLSVAGCIKFMEVLSRIEGWKWLYLVISVSWNAWCIEDHFI